MYNWEIKYGIIKYLQFDLIMDILSLNQGKTLNFMWNKTTKTEVEASKTGIAHELTNEYCNKEPHWKVDNTG